MKKVLVFDLDGTLVNTIYDIANSMNKALIEHHLPTHETKKYIDFIGEGVLVLGKKAVGNREDLLDSVISRYKEIYKANLTNLSKPYLNMNDVLDKLITKGYKLAVISNKPHEDTLEVVNYYYPGKFTYIVGAKPDVIRKPDPMAMNILLKELKVEISDVAYIGDSRYDATFSENCGCDYYLFTYGYDKEEIIKQYKPIAFLKEATDLLKYF